MSDELFGNILFCVLSVGCAILYAGLKREGYDDLAIGCMSASIIFLFGAIGCAISSIVSKKSSITTKEDE